MLLSGGAAMALAALSMAVGWAENGAASHGSAAKAAVGTSAKRSAKDRIMFHYRADPGESCLRRRPEPRAASRRGSLSCWLSRLFAVAPTWRIHGLLVLLCVCPARRRPWRAYPAFRRRKDRPRAPFAHSAPCGASRT